MTDERSNPFPPFPSPTPATAARPRPNALGMRPMQERAYEKRGEQYLLIKSPPASGKSRALMFIALDKLAQPGTQAGHHRRAGEVHRRQLPRRAAEPVRLLGGLEGRAEVEPCDAPGDDNGGKVEAVGAVPRKRRQGAGLHPCHLPLRGGEVRRRGVRRSADRGGRVSPRFGQPGQQAGPASRPVHRPRQGAHRRDDRLLLPRRRRGRAAPRRTKRSSRPSPTPTTSSSTATNISSSSTSATSSTRAPIPTTS